MHLNGLEDIYISRLTVCCHLKSLYCQSLFISEMNNVNVFMEVAEITILKDIALNMNLHTLSPPTIITWL